MQTVNGFIEVSVHLVTGEKQILKVNQLKVGQYAEALKLVDDEIKLVEFVCGQQPGFADTLTPESYEFLYAEVEKVNAKGFFIYSARQLARAEEKLVRRMNQINPETMKVVADKIAGNPLNDSLVGLRPR